ncbi:MAG: phosphoglycerate dehydrogenase [Nitrospinota bacterium]|nr:phosphoglycerate dehydrogenase [Nitrospinota bacterium]
MPKEIIWVGTPFVLNFKDQRQFFRSLESQGYEVLIDDCPAYLSEDELIKKIESATAVIAGAEPYTDKVMGKTPDLKIIARAGVGVNNIDIPSATKNNIVITNAEGQNSSSVSEHFFGLLINCTRRIHWMNEKIRKGAWREIQPALVPLKEQILGIIGFGNIGKLVAKRAKAFEMKVIAYDIVQDQQTANQIGVNFVSLDELAKQSDFLTCHVPLTPDTKHIVDKELLEKMKPEAFVFNTSRGPVFNLDDVTEALKSKTIQGAGIDVYPEEPPDYSHEIFTMENAVLTPHMGGRGVDAVRDTINHAVNCVDDFLKGKKPSTVINHEIYAD